MLEENQLESIIHELHVWGENTAKDMMNTAFIAKTLLKLPEEIREEVIGEVIFIHTTAMGTEFKAGLDKALSKEELKLRIKNMGSRKYFIERIEKSVILLNFKCLRNNRKMDLVAHEIAHFILKHHDILGGPPSDNINAVIEKEADELIKKWGFNPAYKSYRKFTDVQF